MKATSTVNNISDVQSSKIGAKRSAQGLPGLPGIDALSFEQLLGDSAAQLDADAAGLLAGVEALPKPEERELDLPISVDTSATGGVPMGEAPVPATMLQAWQAWLANSETAPAVVAQDEQGDVIAGPNFARTQGREAGSIDSKREAGQQLGQQLTTPEDGEASFRLPQGTDARSGPQALKFDGERNEEPSGAGAGKDVHPTLSLTQTEARKAPLAQLVQVVPIPVPLRAPEWSNAFSEQIVLLVNDGGGRAELRLNPAELGPIDVSLKVQDDRVHASFTIQHAATVDAVQAALPKLEQMLAERGVLLDRVSVEGGDRQPEQNSQQARGSHSGQGQGQGRGGSEHDAQQPPSRTVRRNGLVDTFA